jgi:fructan beta-fructosidase
MTISLRFFSTTVALIVLATSTLLRGNDDLPVAPFSGPAYAPWIAEGNAFTKDPSTVSKDSTIPEKVVVKSGVNGDPAKGTLTSPEFRIQRQAITFLIAGGRWQHNTCLNLIVGGRIVKSATGENSDVLGAKTWDVSAWRGKAAKLRIVDDDSGQWGHLDVSQIIQTDNPKTPPVNVGILYDEKYRPQFHFSAREWTVDKLDPMMREEGWINDVNGPIYYDGEYHLFAQRWNKCWLHAVSRDLVHWTELDPAFWEPSQDFAVQSGTCVIDYQNTSALAIDLAHPAMVAFWAAGAPTQNICFSLDHGRSWKFYQHNPVLAHSSRDPKVFWYEPTRSWVMLLYDDPHIYRIFTSKNLLSWQDEHSEIADCYECPDFFELPVNGNKTQSKWVLIRGNGRYSLGEFDGHTFHEDAQQMPTDSGPNFYAAQTFENTRTGDGRRIQMAWMSGGHYPGMPFNQQLTFPRLLSLRSTPAGLRLFWEPIPEIALLHKSEKDIVNLTLASGVEKPVATSGDLFHIQAEVDLPQGSTLTFHIRGTDMTVEPQQIASGSTAPVSGTVGYVEFLIDRSSIELFANHGEASISQCFIPSKEGISITANGGPVTIKSLKFFELKSAWKK